ncbi:MAG: hypothetical protein Q8R83_07255 [Legionellaceae bacterium]|nr:hypothetical protein [Legionellaceae bacterium]
MYTNYGRQTLFTNSDGSQISHAYQMGNAALEKLYLQVKKEFEQGANIDLDLIESRQEAIYAGIENSQIMGRLADYPQFTYLDKQYRDWINKLIKLENEIRSSRDHNIPDNIPDVLKKLIEMNDLATFKLRLNDLKTRPIPNISEHINYALRFAADKGLVDFIEYLQSDCDADALNPGPKSGRVALYYAIKNGHEHCVKALLLPQHNELNHEYMLFGAPSRSERQLVFGTKPNRAIDAINEIKLEETRNNMINLLRDITIKYISNKLQGSYITGRVTMSSPRSDMLKALDEIDRSFPRSDVVEPQDNEIGTSFQTPKQG